MLPNPNRDTTAHQLLKFIKNKWPVIPSGIFGLISMYFGRQTSQEKNAGRESLNWLTSTSADIIYQQLDSSCKLYDELKSISPMRSHNDYQRAQKMLGIISNRISIIKSLKESSSDPTEIVNKYIALETEKQKNYEDYCDWFVPLMFTITIALALYVLYVLFKSNSKSSTPTNHKIIKEFFKGDYPGIMLKEGKEVECIQIVSNTTLKPTYLIFDLEDSLYSYCYDYDDLKKSLENSKQDLIAFIELDDSRVKNLKISTEKPSFIGFKKIKNSNETSLRPNETENKRPKL